MAPRNFNNDALEGLDLIFKEMLSATAKFGPFRSAHEGYAVLLEEMDELKAEVWKKNKDVDLLEKEAKQVGAMALRFLVDIVFPGKEGLDGKGKSEQEV